jgi:hypothetical protein
MLVLQSGSGGSSRDGEEPGSAKSAGAKEARSVGGLTALSDDELGTVDVIALNLAVARGVPKLSGLKSTEYCRTVDDWARRFRQWLPSREKTFGPPARAKGKGKQDIHAFRLAKLGEFLRSEIGIHPLTSPPGRGDSAKPPQEADPGRFFVHALIDKKRASAATLPVIAVAICRRLDWPVSLACAGSTLVCRYEKGKVRWNLLAEEGAPSGVRVAGDAEVIGRFRLSPRAVMSGSDLRKLSGRQMLGVFLGLRARYFADAGQLDRAERDYCLARSQFPASRGMLMASIPALLWRSRGLFDAGEPGHPAMLARALAGGETDPTGRKTADLPGATAGDPLAEIRRINAINQANMQRLLQPPSPPGPLGPSMPPPTLPGTHAVPGGSTPLAPRPR